MTLDIVIVNWRTPNDLLDCMDSLELSLMAANLGIDRNVWIVNNEPTQADLDVAATKPAWNHITNEANIGYAHACNHAATLGTGSIIGFFNADVVFTSAALIECWSTLTSGLPVDIVGPRQVDLQGRITSAGVGGTHAAPQLRGWKSRSRTAFTEFEYVVSVSGSAYFVKRHVWDELTGCSLYQDVAPGALGAFLPTPHYFEESWCSWHAASHGYRVGYVGTATMVHKWHQASPISTTNGAEQHYSVSQRLFRQACDHHGIEHD